MATKKELTMKQTVIAAGKKIGYTSAGYALKGTGAGLEATGNGIIKLGNWVRDMGKVLNSKGDHWLDAAEVLDRILAGEIDPKKVLNNSDVKVQQPSKEETNKAAAAVKEEQPSEIQELTKEEAEAELGDLRFKTEPEPEPEQAPEPELVQEPEPEKKPEPKPAAKTDHRAAFLNRMKKQPTAKAPQPAPAKKEAKSIEDTPEGEEIDPGVLAAAYC